MPDDNKTIVIENKAAIQTLRERIFNFFFGGELAKMRVKPKVELDQPELHQMLKDRDIRLRDGEKEGAD